MCRQGASECSTFIVENLRMGIFIHDKYNGAQSVFSQLGQIQYLKYAI